jgi:CBS domain-containing protein
MLGFFGSWLESQASSELVEDVMASRVVKIENDATVREAASLMDRRRCSSLVVVRANLALGIVTERDLVRKVLAIGVDPSKVLISDIMSTPLIMVGPKATVIDAAEKMSEYLIRRLVVIDESGVLIGLITAADIARLLAKKKQYADSALNAIARMRKDGTGGPYG